MRGEKRDKGKKKRGIGLKLYSLGSREDEREETVR